MLFVVNKIEALADQYECAHDSELKLVLSPLSIRSFLRERLNKFSQAYRYEYTTIKDF